MSVNVTCPSCQVVTAVSAEVLGRTGRCNRCGARIRLATPVAERLDSHAPAAPVAEPVPMAQAVPEAEPVPPSAPTDWEAAVRNEAAPRGGRRGTPQPRDEDDEGARADRPARQTSAPALLAVLAVVGVIGGATVGALITHALTARDTRKPVEQAAAQPAPRPVPAPAPKPEPKKANPQPPEPAPQPERPVPQPQLPEPKKPDPKPPARTQLTPDGLRFPAAVVNVVAGAGGANLVFHLATGELVFYDARAGKLVGSLSGVEPGAILAAGRDKLFIGRRQEARIECCDLRGGRVPPVAHKLGGGELLDLAVGSVSDGPLVAVTRANGRTHARLLDIDTFDEFPYPVENLFLPGVTAFPVPLDEPFRVAVSADGRALTLNDRWLVGADGRYKGGRLTGGGVVVPVPDGRGFVGHTLHSRDGVQAYTNPLPAGTQRRYVPAPGGPFVLSAEVGRNVAEGVKLQLHLGASAQPLGDLPGGDAVAEWAATDPQWMGKLHQRVIFVPDPGAVVVVQPGATQARVFPVDLRTLFTRAGRDIQFTSIPPAFLRPNRPFVYQVSVISRNGPVAFSLTDGPPGMTLSPEGLLQWPAPNPSAPGDVRVTARVGAYAVSQQFRLEFPADRRVAVAPKKEPSPFDKKEPPFDPPVRPPLPPKKDPPKVEPPPAPAPVLGRLVVTSEPPPATAGARFEYSPAVEAERGGATVTLDYGPEGMVFANGKLTWDVPAALVGQEVRVILTVSDATGQEIFHALRLKVAAKP